MGNHAGNKLDYKQEIMDKALDRAKAECVFTERLYDILLAWQTGRGPIGQQLQGIPSGNVGELNYAMSRLYNLIWAAAIGLNEKAKPKKKGTRTNRHRRSVRT